MATGLISPIAFILQAFSDAGIVGNGYQIATYEAGTSTPVTTYTDSTLVTANPNPIVLRSNGRLPASVWAPAGTTIKMVLMDANNNVIAGGTVDNLPMINDITELFYPQTTAEVNAGVTPTNTLYPQGDVRRYGAVLDGVTDGTAALQTACNVAGDVTIAGSLAVASASLAALTNHAVLIKSNTRIICTYAGSITVTGSTACNLFYSLNSQNIEFINVVANGNNVGTSSLGYAWYCQANGSATGTMSNFRVTGGYFGNFAGYYWIYFDNTAATTYVMRRIRIEEVVFQSFSGNSQGSSSITITASCMGFSGSNSITTFSTMTDILVSGCTADGTYIKNFLFFWSGVNRAEARGNELVNFGADSSISNDVAAYALAAYDFSHGSGLAPDNIVFANNVIVNPRSVGIYIAAGNRVTCVGNLINGQIDTVITTLPKGGIATPGCAVLTLEGNSIDNCVYGVMCLQPPTATYGNNPTYAVINNTSITNIPANGFGLIVGGTGAGSANSIVVDGIMIDDNGNSGATALRIAAESVAGITNLLINNFKIRTANTGVIVFSGDSSTPAIGNMRISNGVIQGASNYGMNLSPCTLSTQRIVVENVMFTSPVAGAALFFINGVVSINVRNLTFCDMTTGSSFCWYATGAQGTVEGVRYQNVAAARRFSGSGNELGSTTPIGVFSGQPSDFIQNLAPTETGTAGSKYIIAGWTYDQPNSAWKQNRTLTGN